MNPNPYQTLETPRFMKCSSKSLEKITQLIKSDKSTRVYILNTCPELLLGLMLKILRRGHHFQPRSSSRRRFRREFLAAVEL